MSDIQPLDFPHTGRPGTRHEQTYTGPLPDNSGKIALLCYGRRLRVETTVLVYPDPESIERAAARVWKKYRWRVFYRGGFVPVAGAGEFVAASADEPEITVILPEIRPVFERRAMETNDMSAKMAEMARKRATTRPIVCPQTGHYFDSVVSAANAYNTHETCIRRVIDGTNEAYAGLFFRHATSDERELQKYIGPIEPLRPTKNIQKRPVVYDAKVYISYNRLTKLLGVGYRKLIKMIGAGEKGLSYATTTEILDHLKARPL